MTSVYSTDSANIYGQVPIRGDIKFGMRYDHVSGIFEVHIFQAKDLAAALNLPEGVYRLKKED